MCECEHENVSSSSPFTRLFSVTLLSGFHLLGEELTESQLQLSQAAAGEE